MFHWPENIKNVKNILFYFIIYVNISAVRRLARDWRTLGVEMARGCTEQRVMFTFTRSYRAVILLPRFIQISSRVAYGFFSHYFWNLIAKNAKYVRILWIINHTSRIISRIFCDCLKKNVKKNGTRHSYLSVRTVSHE